MKVCFVCKENKDDKEFYKSSKSLDGLHHYCKDCLKAHKIKRKRKIKVLWEQVICSMNSYKSYARVTIHSLHSSDSSSETDEKGLLQPMETCSCQGLQRNQGD